LSPARVGAGSAPRRRPAGRLLVAGLVALLAWHPPVVAEDEDTSAAVYLVFDPETGEFVTQDDPNAALPNLTGLENSGAATSRGHGPAAASSDTAAATTSTPLYAALGVAVLLVGGGLVALRRKRAGSASATS
jgi:LPXTG-motif cell wall-anchored protein